MAGRLLEKNGVCEFADPNIRGLMFSPQTQPEDFQKLEQALLSIPKYPPLSANQPVLHRLETVLSIREAMLRPRQRVPIADCVGKILASPSVGCPPAVPLAVCGERLDETAVALFRYYGVEFCDVVK
jgi:arginine/lysine/ornithine decarboxylase